MTQSAGEHQGVLLYYKYVDIPQEEKETIAEWIKARCTELVSIVVVVIVVVLLVLEVVVVVVIVVLV